MTVDRDRCLTCSDEAVQATVVEVRETDATVVRADGSREQVGIELVEPVERGDRLLCHAGVALEKVPA